jgi:hypothetical protein
MWKFQQFFKTSLISLMLMLLLSCWVSPTTNSAQAPFPSQNIYTDSAYLTTLSFGNYSHWLQPWRAYLETQPATTLINGTGVNLFLDQGENPDLVVQMLAKYGIHNIRLEMGWGEVDYERETQLKNSDRLQSILQACRQWGVRPLILLNAHQGGPGPMKTFDRMVTANARAGDRTVKLNDTTGLVVGKSGLSNLTDYWAAEALITAINGNEVTLSKPLPKAIAANTKVPLATLKYQPFSVPNTTSYNETIAAWQNYVGTIGKFTTNALGTAQANDRGFDLEIWNELTFGSQFLSINNYYEPDFAKYEQDSIWENLVKATADYVDAHPKDFQGVRLGNGFSNTIPWTSAAAQPARINAIGKHPYAGRKFYNLNGRNDVVNTNTAIDALGEVDKSGFTPTYSALFPEYYGTALQTETLIRDLAPITTDIYGKTKHGRNARVINNKVNPVPVWITEVNIPPDEDGITDRTQALMLKAKAAARYFTFYLNKGAERVDLFAGDRGDLKYGTVQDNFLEYSKKNQTYPSDDRNYVSPALRVTSRIFAQMQEQLDPRLVQTRAIQVDSISDRHNHYQFEGDGTAAHPNLLNRDLLTVLPFQVNAHKFVIPYYVMTRDIRKSLAPEEYTIQLSGVRGEGAVVRGYDVMGDRAVPVKVNRRSGNSLNLNLLATDYPYLLVIQEKAD